MSGYAIIDADKHVTETPDLWTSRAPASMRDRVPRIETSSKGAQRWVLGGVARRAGESGGDRDGGRRQLQESATDL